MIVETHNYLCDPQRIEATRVVIRNEFDEPVCVVIEHARGMFVVTHRGEPTFNQALEALGITSTFFTDTVIEKTPQQGQLWLPSSRG